MRTENETFYVFFLFKNPKLLIFSPIFCRQSATFVFLCTKTIVIHFDTHRIRLEKTETKKMFGKYNFQYWIYVKTRRQLRECAIYTSNFSTSISKLSNVVQSKYKKKNIKTTLKSLNGIRTLSKMSVACGFFLRAGTAAGIAAFDGAVGRRASSARGIRAAAGSAARTAIAAAAVFFDAYVGHFALYFKKKRIQNVNRLQNFA